MASHIYACRRTETRRNIVEGDVTFLSNWGMFVP